MLVDAIFRVQKETSRALLNGTLVKAVDGWTNREVAMVNTREEAT
jgi:hypothetical protein